MMKRTPLFAAHQRRGGKLIEFGGWEMPVQYSSIVDEHLCVRRASGVFDISHMGEVWVSGRAAAEFLNVTLTNDIRRLEVGIGHYTQMCNPAGGTVDDLYIYRVANDRFLLIVNASRIDADVAWLRGRLASFPNSTEVVLQDESADWGAIAIQGPRVVEFIDGLISGPSMGGTKAAAPTLLTKNQLGVWRWNGAEILVARTGYTGEDGFEVIAPGGLIEELWERSLSAGHGACVQPCGLGARDTLRTEACYPLYGHELDESTSPIEAGLGIFVGFDKGEFVGRPVLWAQKSGGLVRKLVAFKMTEKSPPPRPGYSIVLNGVSVGTVVSGTQSPSLNLGIGLGFVPTALASPGTRMAIEIRGRPYAAEQVKKPFYRRTLPAGV